MLSKSLKHIVSTLHPKWLITAVLVGALAGSASALLLLGLGWAADMRGDFPWLLFLLPLGGLGVGALYHYYGKDVAKGNNQLIEEVQQPEKLVPFKMAPLVFIGTIITHLFGGSAGREGTAVQMGGSIADQFSKWFGFTQDDRRILIQLGIAAGFSSLFGTPFTAIVFAAEIIFIGKLRLQALLPSVISAFVAYYVCNLWPVEHTHYVVNADLIPSISVSTVAWSVLAGIAFGLASLVFSEGMHRLGAFYKKVLKNPLLIPVIGGLVVVGFSYFFGAKYWGLGIPGIIESFGEQQGIEVFAIKIFLTVLTLGAGYKGGEVTPLFFIGAALGSALSLWIPLPVGLLAGMGFVAVFSGAANSPIACAIMGIELFGYEGAVYYAIAVTVAYYCSGHKGIYRSQIVKRRKLPFLSKY